MVTDPVVSTLAWRPSASGVFRLAFLVVLVAATTSSSSSASSAAPAGGSALGADVLA